MLVQKTTEQEIAKVFNTLQFFSWIYRELKHEHIENICADEEQNNLIDAWRDIINNEKLCERDKIEQVISNVCAFIDSTHWERVLLNCQTMLEHCADPNSEALQFKPEIKQAIEFYEKRHDFLNWLGKYFEPMVYDGKTISWLKIDPEKHNKFITNHTSKEIFELWEQEKSKQS